MFTDRQGEQWDLDDEQTYTSSWFPGKHLKLSVRDLHLEVQNTIGWSLFYMICCHPRLNYDAQYHRVVEFGKHFARESREKDRWENVAWLRKQLFMILDETENQC